MCVYTLRSENRAGVIREKWIFRDIMTCGIIICICACTRAYESEDSRAHALFCFQWEVRVYADFCIK